MVCIDMYAESTDQCYIAQVLFNSYYCSR